MSYGHFLSQLSVNSEFNGSGPHGFLPTLYKADFTVILAAQRAVRESHAARRNRFYVSDIFRPSPEITPLERRRRRGAVLS